MKSFGRWAWTRFTTLGNDAGKGWITGIVIAAIIGGALGFYARANGLGPFGAGGKVGGK
jgi:hypothetical protein